MANTHGSMSGQTSPRVTNAINLRLPTTGAPHVRIREGHREVKHGDGFCESGTVDTRWMRRCDAVQQFPCSLLPGYQLWRARLYDDMLAQAKLVDRLGFKGVTIPEHHLINILLIPDPLQFAVKVASITEHLEIVTSVCQSAACTTCAFSPGRRSSRHPLRRQARARRRPRCVRL